MILAVAFALCLLTIPLFRGRFSGLATLRIRRQWSIMAALVIQVLIISVIPDRLPSAVGATLHLASYGLTLVFAAANWRIPGMVVLVAGGLANLAAIGANGGVMPASQRALEVSGRAPIEGEFINSEVQDDPHLLVLGDVFALPAGVPFANVFSVGDVLLVVGGTIVAHRAAGSTLPWRRTDTGGGDPLSPRAWEPVGSCDEPDRAQAGVTAGHDADPV